jgi:hypothetical protein
MLLSAMKNEPPTWGLPQVWLDGRTIGSLQSPTSVRAGQATLIIKSQLQQTISIISGTGGRNSNPTPAASPDR